MGDTSNKKMFSIILAFRNEGDFLKKCLDSLDRQSLSRSEWEVILIDGNSTDQSTGIAKEYEENNDNVLLLNNEKRIVTSGWNIGIRAASGKYFCLAGGHSIYDEDYLLKAKEILINNPEINSLGGRVYKIGIDKFSNSIAECTNTSFAMGGSYYRIGEIPKEVNGIGAGIYERSIIDKIGYFDESLFRSGDYEFNYRVTHSGYSMHFDPELKIYFYSRANFKSLFLQQFRTGYWKVKIWAKHRGAILPRQLIPVFFVLWLISIFIFLFVGYNTYLIWLLPVVLYLILALLFSFKTGHKNTNRIAIFVAYPILHIGYGFGVIAGMIKWWKAFLKT